MSVNRPKQFEVVKRTTRPMRGVNVGGKELKFGRHDAFIVNDAGIARELQRYHKKDVVVAEVDRPHRDVSRNFHGSMPEMPWHRKGRKRRELG